MAASLLFLLPLALLWVLFVRPQQRGMRQAQAMAASLDVGDEIITSGGIYGTVTDTDDTSLWVEIAPDVIVHMKRGAVAQLVTPTESDDYDDTDYQADNDETDDDSDADEGSATESHGSAVLNGGAPKLGSPADDEA